MKKNTLLFFVICLLISVRVKAQDNPPPAWDYLNVKQINPYINIQLGKQHENFMDGQAYVGVINNISTHKLHVTGIIVAYLKCGNQVSSVFDVTLGPGESAGGGSPALLNMDGLGGHAMNTDCLGEKVYNDPNNPKIYYLDRIRSVGITNLQVTIIDDNTNTAATTTNDNNVTPGSRNNMVTPAPAPSTGTTYNPQPAKKPPVLYNPMPATSGPSQADVAAVAQAFANVHRSDENWSEPFYLGAGYSHALTSANLYFKDAFNLSLSYASGKDEPSGLFFEGGAYYIKAVTNDNVAIGSTIGATQGTFTTQSGTGVIDLFAGVGFFLTGEDASVHIALVPKGGYIDVNYPSGYYGTNPNNNYSIDPGKGLEGLGSGDQGYFWFGGTLNVYFGQSVKLAFDFIDIQKPFSPTSTTSPARIAQATLSYRIF